jgi:(1->4)-alpha-D-glucan 1-alpha-D-glucosylmutase
MIATYRVQLTPEFGFDRLRERLPYLRRLGVSHLYLSPITEAAAGSTHGYDVTDHNTVRLELGGRQGFDSLREAALAEGLELLLDVVPNHAGVGPGNEAWQDVLAYGPASPHARTFDIDWNPPKPELRGKVLLPFLGRPYGEALDDGEISLSFDAGYFRADYYDDSFRLSPATYATILETLLPELERQPGYFDLLELHGLYRELESGERDKAEALRLRLVRLFEEVDSAPALAFDRESLHELLERQHWRLAYWKTAGDEINYRRFFDVNGLVALRMEEPSVFWDAHRLWGELLQSGGVHGLRIDHVDGLVDPHGYLESLATLGASRVWVEKIVAPGETLPEEWPTCGTTGYEFMNDVVRLLVHPGGEESLRRTYDDFLDGPPPYRREVLRCKRLVMETTLAGELTRLTNTLYRLSEADYHTRDFTKTALRNALADIIASLERYRTYLPHGRDEAAQVLRQAVEDGKRLAENVETSVFDFVMRCLTEPMPAALEPAREEFVGRFQQYTAPVAAKGVEDTAFYRYVPLAALNEVGGNPDLFTIEPQAFHSRARFRQHRYPANLLATATHDHKRGEDTRMRLAVLSELPDEWRAVAERLDERSQRFWRESGPLGAARISRRDAYLYFQHLIALWEDESPPALASRLREYMLKAVREAKQESSWIDPDAAYEAAVEQFVAEMTVDGEVAGIVAPLAAELAHYGFLNALSQLVLKLTTPGVPDVYQGTELIDLSLVDPDNRRPVDFLEREAMLSGLGPVDDRVARQWASRRDPRLKLLMLHRLLCHRREHQELIGGAYRPLEPPATEGATEPLDEHLIAFSRESGDERLLVLVPRFAAVLERRSREPEGSTATANEDWCGGKWGDSRLDLPPDLRGGAWQEVITGARLELGEYVALADLPFLPAVLHRRLPPEAGGVNSPGASQGTEGGS